MSRGVGDVQLAIPSLDPWQRNFLIGLFAAYVFELILHNAGVPLYDWFVWFNFGSGFAPWQPVTRFLVQGASRGAVGNVLLSLVVLYFFLPTMSRLMDLRTLGVATIAGAVGGTVLPLVIDATGFLSPGAALGWGVLVLTLPALLGLARPHDTILLLVFPVKARWFLWGALIVALLYIAVEQSLDTFVGLGVWLGVYGWWHGMGPGANRRRLSRSAAGIERELHNLTVIDGGKQGTPKAPKKDQGQKGPPPKGQEGGPDDWVH